jgi:nucleoside-diphosphate-sugar epimerase
VRILITGATSLVGRAVVRRLADRGDQVATLQRHAGIPGTVEHRADITDPAGCEGAVAGAEAVIHLAARVGVSGRWDQFLATNVAGTRNMLAAARNAGVERFVHVSSPSVAHHGSSLVGAGAGPADPDRVRGHYARSKALAEQAALEANGGEFSVAVVRPHLIWGPGDTQLTGRIVDRAGRGRLARIGSGAALIDTTFVDNAADALVAALDRAREIGGRPLVVSNGEPRPVGELIDRITAAAGLSPPRRRVPYRLAFGAGWVIERLWEWNGRESDPPITSFLAEQLATAHWFDQRETRRLLGWEPAVTLDDGFARLRDWYSERTEESA